MNTTEKFEFELRDSIANAIMSAIPEMRTVHCTYLAYTLLEECRSKMMEIGHDKFISSRLSLCADIFLDDSVLCVACYGQIVHKNWRWFFKRVTSDTFNDDGSERELTPKLKISIARELAEASAAAEKKFQILH